MRWVPLVLLVACNGDPYVPDTDTDTGDADTDTDTDTDTEPQGTDEDGDGWTVEEGDCDDDDVYVNPGWDEREDDDKDNDCDGRIDEVMIGVNALYVNVEGAEASALHQLDTFGELEETVGLDAAIFPQFFDDNLDRSGWLGWDPTNAILWDIAKDGTVEVAADLSEVEWPEDDAPYSLTGVAQHPDGYALISGWNQLLKLPLDGSADYEVVATWPFVEEDGSHDIAVYDIAVDPLTGTVGMFGLLGGIATWHAEQGYTLYVQEDLEEPTGGFYYAQSTEKGALFALGYVAADGDEFGIFRFKPEDSTLTRRGRWANSSGASLSDYSPAGFAIDTEEDNHFYVTANGGWYRTVWKVFNEGEDSYASQLYTNVLSDPPDPDDADRMFLGITIRWDEK